jgi:hypothetical protein
MKKITLEGFLYTGFVLGRKTNDKLFFFSGFCTQGKGCLCDIWFRISLKPFY